MVVFLLSWLLAAGALGLGNTVGYHRLLTHRSFRCPGPVRGALTLLGAMHGGSPMMWVGLHRLHHAKSDGPEDPHTTTRGFWFAHSGWLIGTQRPLPAILFALSGFGQQGAILVHDLRRLAGRRSDDWVELCPDLVQEPLMRWLDRPLVMPALFLAQLGIALGLFGAPGLLWLWSLHLLLTNSSWAVNSVCHWPGFGRQPHATGDLSRDVPWLALLTNGESYHNGHHRFPRSARHALDGGLDTSWLCIRALAALGLATEVWLPRSHRPPGGSGAPGAR